ncbi:hypothetical protein ACIBGW_49870, partial [Streptomyces sp. NPDC051016]
RPPGPTQLPPLPPLVSRTQQPPPAAAPAKSPALTALERAASDVHERAYVPLAPSAVRAALAEDAPKVVQQLADLEAEIERVTKRLAAARRAVDAHASVNAGN